MIFQLHSSNISITNHTLLEQMNIAQEETSEELGIQYRARSNDRRVKKERRRDTRTMTDQKYGFKAWVKSLTSPRLGVDRRKGSDQRRLFSPASHSMKSLLTQEEIADLLK